MISEILHFKNLKEIWYVYVLRRMIADGSFKRILLIYLYFLNFSEVCY